VGKQVEFYERVIGLVVSDRGVSSRIGNEFAFMTGAAEHHHQVVFISGRAQQGATTVNQLSFKVSGLEELKEMYRRAREAGVRDIRQINHGNAFSFYMNDPEGNGVEVYIDTPWYVPQPHGVPIDLTLPSEQLLSEAERHCRETPGFMPLDAWRAEVASRLEHRH
jgi:catechol 2,3-dioxygenase